MLSPLRPLLCRHDFYWSERHRSERCRRCGKLKAAEALAFGGGEAPRATDAATSQVDPFGSGVQIGASSTSARLPGLMRSGAWALTAEARERRDRLPGTLERLIHHERPTWEEAIDAVLAVIEDAHSADPVIFGPGAADHFARLHEARSAPR